MTIITFVLKVALPEDWPFWKKQLILQNNFVKLIPQLVPMNGLHANICVLQIGPLQSERVYISVEWKFVWEKIKMSVTSAYFECATGNRYHRIELADSFLLKYRYWTFTKITASASRKKFWTSEIATSQSVVNKVHRKSKGLCAVAITNNCSYRRYGKVRTKR